MENSETPVVGHEEKAPQTTPEPQEPDRVERIIKAFNCAGTQIRSMVSTFKKSFKKTPVNGDGGKATNPEPGSPKPEDNGMEVSMEEITPTEAQGPASHINGDTNTAMIPKFDLKKTLSELPDNTHNFRMCACYGNLDVDTIKTVDENSKVIIAATTKAIFELKKWTWDSVLNCMMQIPLLRPFGNAITRRSDEDAFSQIGEVRPWFEQLIRDDEIIEDMKIDQELSAKIMSKIRCFVDDNASGANSGKTVSCTNPEPQERTILDVGVLRYPDIDFPYFKFYRIKLTASHRSSGIFYFQNVKKSITGEFTCRKFSPRKMIIKGLGKEAVDKSITEAEALFG